jgi:hypothetical protein
VREAERVSEGGGLLPTLATHSHFDDVLGSRPTRADRRPSVDRPPVRPSLQLLTVLIAALCPPFDMLSLVMCPLPTKSAFQ